MTRDEVIATLKELRYLLEDVSDRASIALYLAVEMLNRDCKDCEYKKSVKQALEGMCDIYDALK